MRNKSRVACIFRNTNTISNEYTHLINLIDSSIQISGFNLCITHVDFFIAVGKKITVVCKCFRKHTWAFDKYLPTLNRGQDFCGRFDIFFPIKNFIRIVTLNKGRILF